MNDWEAYDRYCEEERAFAGKVMGIVVGNYEKRIEKQVEKTAERVFSTMFNKLIKSLEPVKEIESQYASEVEKLAEQRIEEMVGTCIEGKKGAYYCDYCKAKMPCDSSGDSFLPKFCHNCGRKFLNSPANDEEDEKE